MAYLIYAQVDDYRRYCLFSRRRMDNFSSRRMRAPAAGTDQPIGLQPDRVGSYCLKIVASNDFGATSETDIQKFTLKAADGFPAAYNYPNPFNPLRGGTNIVFNAPAAGFRRAVVSVYSEMQDLLFRREYTGIPAGVSEIKFDGRDRFGRALFNGSYICRVRFEGPDHEEIFYLLVVK